ncbi:MAG TPA: hypothetical protein DCG12_12725, partial [Planctomycetaceae bacterium]|nr:hypothetical protein [Planctomycetaceae bacterium]
MARLVRFIPWVLLALFVGLLAWSWFSEGIVHELLSGDLTAKQRVQRLKQFFDGFGSLGPLVYLVFVVVEVVVAPIPGLMLYAPGGIIFGPLVG